MLFRSALKKKKRRQAGAPRESERERDKNISIQQTVRRERLRGLRMRWAPTLSNSRSARAELVREEMHGQKQEADTIFGLL